MSTVRAFAVPAAAVMVLSSMLVKGAQRLGAVFFSNRPILPYRLALVDSAGAFRLAPLPYKKLHPQGADRTRDPSARNNNCGVEAAPRQPFWACRCFRNELRRVIRAFAIRMASDLGDCFFGSGVLVSAAVVGLMRNCVAAVEPCATGCTFIGPADVGLRFGIIDNARAPGWFDAPVGRGRAQRI
jgi:hypothetical protein